MRFAFSDEQQALKNEARRVLQDAPDWSRLVELGWPGLTIPEEYGGAGLGWVELCALLEEMGRVLSPLPLFSNALAAEAIWRTSSDSDKRQHLPALAEGRVRAALVVAGRALDDADLWVFSDGSVKTNVERRTLESFDLTRPMVEVVDPPNAPLHPSVQARALIALAAEQLGGAERCLEMAVEYAQTRQQFGRPIGSFQAIKHMCADMLVRVESARSASYWAAWAASVDDAELPVAASLAKVWCGEAYFRNAADNIQIHGGIGFTWEHAAHRYFRRARATLALFGDLAEHRELFGHEARAVNVHPGTLPGALFSAATRFGDRVAVIDGETPLSFRALTLLVEDTARAFMALGVGRGDRVALWAPNGWAWQVVALGAQLAGGVIVPLNTRFKGREAAALLGKTRARILVIQNQFLGVDYLAQLRESGTRFTEDGGVVIALGAAVPPDALRWTAFLARAFSIPREGLYARAQALTPDDVSDIIFTSGTTGRPKGVLATHAQTVRVFRTWSELAGLDAEDRYLVVNPYFHTFGYKAGWLACLLTGATCLPQAVFDAGEVLRRIERDRITVLPGPPTLYQALLDHPERGQHDLSTLRLAVTGAATIPITLVQRMREELGFQTVLTAYGLTEATGVVTMCRADDSLETIAHTSGRAIPGVEVEVMAPTGEPGEVRVRGYNVMPGYFEDRDESRAALDEEGWLHTGDVGILDAYGNLRITDRIKDMFIVGGFNAYPAEIEDLLAEHRAIRRVAVVGAPDSRMGEVGVAFVVLRSGARTTPDEIIAWARGRMANYKVPRRVEIVSELPENAVGKVLKQVLRERAAGRDAS